VSSSRPKARVVLPIAIQAHRSSLAASYASPPKRSRMGTCLTTLTSKSVREERFTYAIQVGRAKKHANCEDYLRFGSCC
jgi:hypothetical protein